LFIRLFKPIKKQRDLLGFLRNRRKTFGQRRNAHRQPAQNHPDTPKHPGHCTCASQCRTQAGCAYHRTRVVKGQLRSELRLFNVIGGVA